MSTNDRELIFDRIRSAVGALREPAPLPEFSDELVVRRNTLSAADSWQRFAQRMQAIHGHAFANTTELAAWLRREGWTHGYCDPELWPVLGASFSDGFTVETTFDRRRIDDYQFGLTRAAGAIAETGSIILKDTGSSPRLAALAPWVHIAAFKSAEIHPTLPDAVRALGDDPNIIWVTGPSKTGDIESVLVEGMHGPGVQVALLLV
jgi:L-lactate dehydrogenase complex protein LldG